MDLQMWPTAKGVWLAVLLDVTFAESASSRQTMQRRWSTDSNEHWDDDPFTVPTSIVVWSILAAILAVIVILFVCCCMCSRRSRMQAVRQPLVPPPMAPATLGPAVRSYTQPPVPRRLTAPAAPYPQPQPYYYQQQQTAPYPQEGLYVGHNMAPFTEPLTAPTPLPSAPVPPPPPPPYSYGQQYGR